MSIPKIRRGILKREFQDKTISSDYARRNLSYAVYTADDWAGVRTDR